MVTFFHLPPSEVPLMKLLSHSLRDHSGFSSHFWKAGLCLKFSDTLFRSIVIEFASKSAVPYMAAEEFLSICKKKKREFCVCVFCFLASVNVNDSLGWKFFVKFKGFLFLQLI